MSRPEVALVVSSSSLSSLSVSVSVSSLSWSVYRDSTCISKNVYIACVFQDYNFIINILSLIQLAYIL